MNKTKTADLKQLLREFAADANAPAASCAALRQAAREHTVEERNKIVDEVIGANQVVYIGGLNVSENARTYFKSGLETGKVSPATPPVLRRIKP
jgi:predicted NodU family carbamoyl transferase